MTRIASGALLMTLCFMGCNQPPAADTSSSSAVGVVDLDRAANELGLTQQVTDILKAEDQKLVNGLLEIKQKFQAQIDAKKKEIGETPAAKDKEELQVMELQANQILANMQQRSQLRLQEVRGALVQQLRLKFSESVQGIAKKHQMKVVLTSPNDAVIYSAATVDVTGELIEAMRDSSKTIKLEAPGTSGGTTSGAATPPPAGGNPSEKKPFGTTTGFDPPDSKGAGEKK